MNNKKTRGKAHILSKRQQCLPLISQSHSDSKITHIAIIFSVCVPVHASYEPCTSLPSTFQRSKTSVQ